MTEQLKVNQSSPNVLSQSVVHELSTLVSEGKLRAIDMQFGKLMLQLSRPTEPCSHWLIGLMAALVSYELGQGNICLVLPPHGDLQSWLCQRLGLSTEQRHRLSSQWIVREQWQSDLKAFAVVGEPTRRSATPMILDGESLYIQRYWYYEQSLASALVKMAHNSAIEREHQVQLAATLEQLFKRDYDLLFQLWQQQSGGEADTKNWLVSALDIAEPQSVDWSAIFTLFENVNSPSQLESLDTLVPNSVCLNWQKVAAAVALSKQFAIISGGPGTGKTTTVVKLLAAAIEQSKLTRNLQKDDQAQSMVIQLVAPTGKAAARLTESIGGALQKLPIDPEIKALIPTKASTIHRLLGAIPNNPEFKHHSRNPLHLDMLVVDEASMVDLSMMVKLVDALPKHARLVLLGDKDQLSSVEAGAVLGDLFSFHRPGYSEATQQLLTQLTGYKYVQAQESVGVLTDNLCLLQKSYRFDAQSGIGQLARAVNIGSTSQYHKIKDGNFSDIERYSLDSEHYSQLFKQLGKRYRAYLDQQSSQDMESDVPESQMFEIAKAKLKLFQTTRLLCAVREGEFGVVQCNRRIERELAAQRLIQPSELWYVGRPIMVTQNDHSLGLFNGDIGICLIDQSNPEGRLKVYFELPDGNIKAVLPSRVPAHETGFAMTIHKSQGSEFDATYMLLPQNYTPLLSRELVYTGITRAKKSLHLYANTDVIDRAINSPTLRASGLARALEKTKV
jgi:exodeoxyribonuclease V alpha subunit